MIKKKQDAKNLSPKNIAIIGCGHMGSAIAENLSKTENIYLYDRHYFKSESLAKNGFGIPCKSLKEALKQADVLILAIKPQNVAEASQEFKKLINSNHILISILAGITLDSLKSYFPKCHILRMMPNIALKCGEGMIALSCKQEEQEAFEKKMGTSLNPLGKLLWLPESKIDAFTALAGSGPAFIFALTESMVEAGIAMGFSASESQEIIHQMIQGSVSLMKTSRKHPAELKWQVTSPAGTTIAGLVALEKSAIRSGIIQTFLTTYEKAVRMKE